MDIQDLIKNGANITLNVTASDLKQFGEDLIKGIPKESEKKQDSKNTLLTGEQVCKMLSISRVTLWDWDKKGITDPVRLGNLKRYRLSDIEELIKKKEVNDE